MMETTDLQIGRYMVLIEVWDNEADEHIVDEAFNTSGLTSAVSALQRAVFDLETEIRRRNAQEG